MLWLGNSREILHIGAKSDELSMKGARKPLRPAESMSSDIQFHGFVSPMQGVEEVES